MIRALFLLLFSGVAFAGPVKAPQRVIFHTLAGDLVFRVVRGRRSQNGRAVFAAR